MSIVIRRTLPRSRPRWRSMTTSASASAIRYRSPRRGAFSKRESVRSLSDQPVASSPSQPHQPRQQQRQLEAEAAAGQVPTMLPGARSITLLFRADSQGANCVGAEMSQLVRSNTWIQESQKDAASSVTG